MNNITVMNMIFSKFQLSVSIIPSFSNMKCVDI